MVSVQPNMQIHDDLAALFSRNLTFNAEVAASHGETRNPEPAPAAPSPQPTYSVSQHYHHSAHTVKPPAQSEGLAQGEKPQRPSSEPPQTETLNSENVLRIHGIDPSGLTPSQLQLFRIAEPPQQMRLLELWSICPPNGGADIPALAWSSTTIENEEHLARMRFERLQYGQAMSLDGTTVQTGNGRWVHQAGQESEPYMNCGYEELMRREREAQTNVGPAHGVYDNVDSNYTHATDPVYLGPDWARQQQQMDMATQYGAFEQLRGGGEADVMDVM